MIPSEQTRNQNGYWKFQAKVFLSKLKLLRRLEFYRLHQSYIRKVPHENEFLFFRKNIIPCKLFVDIGANIGQSAVSFASCNNTAEILSFEPNPQNRVCLEYVKKLLGPRFDFHMHGLSEENTTLICYTPSVRGVSISQDATIYKDQLFTNDVTERIKHTTGTSNFDIIEERITVKKLDDLSLSPDVVKIDVQGAEENVLRGMHSTLERCRPILLMEGLGVAIEMLTKLRYRFFVYSADTNKLIPLSKNTTSAWNSFCIPEENLSTIRDQNGNLFQ